MEEAGRLKEKGKVTEIVAVTIGGAKNEETLRTARAFGEDRAIHIKEEGELQPLTAAKAFAAVLRKEDAQLSTAGNQAIDPDTNTTGKMVSDLLDISQAPLDRKSESDDDTGPRSRETHTRGTT